MCGQQFYKSRQWRLFFFFLVLCGGGGGFCGFVLFEMVTTVTEAAVVRNCGC